MFLIGFCRSFGVAELALQITFILLVEFQDTFPESPLQVGIDIHLDSARSRWLRGLDAAGCRCRRGIRIYWPGTCFQFFFDVILLFFR